MVAALGLSACGADRPPPPGTSDHAASSTAPSTGAAVAPLPPPEDLTAVLYQLADLSIPGERKLALVQFATAADQPALENFGQALADGGFRELTVEATDLTWSSTPGNVIATVRFGAVDDPAKTFSYPMEFSPTPSGWLLTRPSADQLLTLGGPPG